MSDDLEKLIKTTIQTKVVEAFNAAPEAIEKLVACALNKEVDSHGGKPDRFSSRDNMPYMDWLVGEEIRRAVKETVADYVKEHGGAIKEQVKRSISNADFGTPLADKVAEIMDKDYSWYVNVDLRRHSDDK